MESRIHFILDRCSTETTKNIKTIIYSGIIFIFVLLSVFIVPEARFPDNPEEQDGAIEITKENAYIIENEEGYTIYIEGQYFADINYIPEDLEDIPVYKKEHIVNEKQ
ncbi:MAG: hypothetical protein U0L05_00925 [Schaedlerella sp.]|nr:hypothetical protein [Schaedlerella sp.]